MKNIYVPEWRDIWSVQKVRRGVRLTRSYITVDKYIEHYVVHEPSTDQGHFGTALHTSLYIAMLDAGYVPSREKNNDIRATDDMYFGRRKRKKFTRFLMERTGKECSE